ncbi:MAG: RNA polymerase sigma factor [Candidatus Rokuibacteriota bacterium]
MHSDSDDALLQQLTRGEASAVETLMQRFGGRCYRLAFGVVRNAADAEEIVQDVFLSILRKHTGFEGRAALGSWIYRITVNTALNKRRGKRSEVEVPLENYLPVFKPDGHRAGDRAMLIADWSQSPDAALTSAETRRLVQEGIEVLPPPYRAILIMRDVEELSNEETAEALGETVAAVKSRVHRARMALREYLTRHLGAVRPA